MVLALRDCTRLLRVPSLRVSLPFSFDYGTKEVWMLLIFLRRLIGRPNQVFLGAVEV
jgi:hypothetical protein